MTRLILMLALALPVLGAAGEANAAAPAAPVVKGAPANAPLLLAQAADTADALPVQMAPSKPSGFWGSTRPAQGGAYRYGLLGVGVVVFLLTLGMMLWVLRRPARALPRSSRSA